MILKILLILFTSTFLNLHSVDKYRTINAYSYYMKALETAIEGRRKYKNKNEEMYRKTMEEAIEYIKKGNQKSIYYPPEGSIMGMSNEEYERKSKVSEEVCDISLKITGGMIELGKYLVKKWENVKEEEIWEMISEIGSYIKFTERVVFSPKPPPLFFRINFVGGLCIVLEGQLIPTLKKLHMSQEVKLLEEYKNQLYNYYKEWSEILKRGRKQR